MAAAMTPDDFPEHVNALCHVCHLFGERQWCLATSGNFSVRIDETHCLITQSGREKSILSGDDLMVCDLRGQATDPDDIPSAETPVHTCLYALEPDIGAVLHTHSVAATILSRDVASELTLEGFEMQKAFTGVTEPNESINILVLENDQDLHALAERVGQAWVDNRFRVPGFLIRGHGLYAWGRDLREAQRHTEGLEFLLDCVLKEKLMPLE